MEGQRYKNNEKCILNVYNTLHNVKAVKKDMTQYVR
jgi:hypothetical protein